MGTHVHTPELASGNFSGYDCRWKGIPRHLSKRRKARRRLPGLFLSATRSLFLQRPNQVPNFLRRDVLAVSFREDEERNEVCPPPEDQDSKSSALTPLHV